MLAVVHFAKCLAALPKTSTSVRSSVRTSHVLALVLPISTVALGVGSPRGPRQRGASHRFEVAGRSR
jgi:hypothetical protein